MVVSVKALNQMRVPSDNYWATARDRDTSMVVAAFSEDHFRYARRLARILKSAVACSSIFAIYNLRKNMENHIN